MKIKSYGKTELAKIYGVNLATFKNWLDDVPRLVLKPNQRIFTPKQVRQIVAHLDSPED